MNDLKRKISELWWYLWTGYGSLEQTRHALEEEVRRFNGTITWEDDASSAPASVPEVKAPARRPSRKAKGKKSRRI